MLRGTHKRIMEVACDFLLIPDSMKSKLISACQKPDDEDSGIPRVMRHILIPVPGGYVGSANQMISKHLDMALKGEDPVEDVGEASHYLVDISQPFHTSLYSFYRQGYHAIVEQDIDNNFKVWLTEYSPKPQKIASIEKFVTDTAKGSQAMANDLLLAFAKHELMGEIYPYELEKKAMFRAIDNQISLLQYCKINKLMVW